MSGKHSIPDPTEVPYYDYDTDEVPFYHVKMCNVITGNSRTEIPCFLHDDTYYKCNKNADGKWIETNEIIHVEDPKKNIREKFDNFNNEVKPGAVKPGVVKRGGGIHKRKSKKSKRNGSRKSKTTKPRKTKKRSKRKKNSTSRKKSSRKRV
jgi:hypothetical protein